MKQLQLFVLVLVLGTASVWAQPVVSSFSPATGGTGTTVTITGSGFNTTASNNVVYFGAAQATVSSATATQLVVTSPTSVSGAAKICVSNLGTNLTGESKSHFTPTFPYGISTNATCSTQFVSQATGTNAGPNLSGEGTGRNSGKKMVSGDFDADGKIDFIAMGINSANTINIYRNTNATVGSAVSASSFSSSSMTIDANSFGLASYTYDFNNDGKLDVLIGRSDGFTILVNTSTSGSISFSKTTYSPTGTYSTYYCIGSDLDKDGKIDVIGINPFGSNISVFKNTSSGGTLGFNTTPTNLSAGYTVGDVVAGDINGDGDNEIIYTTITWPANDNMRFFDNTNSVSGTMSISSTSTNISSNIVSGSYSFQMPMTIADLDNDGDLDLTCVTRGGVSTTSLVYLFVNAGNGTFTQYQIGTYYLSYNITYSSRIGDINGDGKLDIIFHEGNSSGGIQVIMNNYSSGTMNASSFSNYSTLSTNYSIPIGFVVDDFNQDGKIDVIYNGYYNANLFYCTNGNAIYFAKASGASNLSVLSNWSSTMDGTGSAPANFTSGSFVLDNTQGTTSFSTGGAWTFGASLGIPSGKRLNISNNTNWTVTGTVDNAGYILGGTGSTLTYTLNTGTTYNGNAKLVNLTITGTSAQVTISGNDTVTGTMTIGGNRTLALAATARLVVPGTFTNQGQLSCAVGSNLVLNGSSAQTIGGNSNVISNLTINNAAGVSLGVASTVNASITFVNGLLKLGNYNLTYNGSTMSGTSSTSYVQTNGTGRLVMTIGNNASKTYPVGVNYYNPVAITNNTGTSDVFSVLTLADVYYNGASGVVCNDPHVRCTWDINKTNANAGSGVGLKFFWVRAQESGNMISSWPVPGVQHHDGTNWTNTTFTTQLLYDTTTSLFSLDHQNYSGSFSPFAVGSFITPLPVKLFDVTAAAEGNKVALNWKATGEELGTLYEVMHSANGADWKSLGTLNALNVDQSMNQYHFDHFKPEAINYYKIKISDAKNNVAYSQVLRVNFEGSINSNLLYVYPNPSNGRVTFNVANNSQYNLIDANGRIIMNGVANGETVLQNLTPGVYALTVYHQDAVETTQIVVK